MLYYHFFILFTLIKKISAIESSFLTEFFNEKRGVKYGHRRRSYANPEYEAKHRILNAYQNSYMKFVANGVEMSTYYGWIHKGDTS
ncbi:hypothetical protein A3Q56_05763 [Intoshia linei]|uniref:Uncharacterized protein n=1 Tax=Intoshia linei TaxID=1819745 RepID=A0A177AXC2_9BILA|nr:hypothetical protein A3Q56_05763 [Intoshia linei]